ncbi:DUF2637 domain-containing protein [Kitasatospora sp. RB6PN24]|uniref:DUF2637 domain-containing protein n=1 Tax=Kitasatospora humi TaxID=2893891 RepID=UPI001E297528|nr:DUF2637 domain-containing protein [Kitasatospora humi]MCC9311943.1 DUF2637 domain-containing protein [Kitasatospora humi]
MPSTQPATRPTGFGAFARVTITLVMAVTAGLAFSFSFGNVWALALRLGIPRSVAPLIAPMVDLSVVGLLVALHHLAATGTEPTQLRSATRLMHLCGLLTLTLNTAEPVLAQHYGRALLDAVAPALLLGWGSVGPNLLRLIHAPATSGAEHGHDRCHESERSAQSADDRASAPLPPSGSSSADTEQGQPTNSEATTEPAEDAPLVHRKPVVGTKRLGRRPAATMEELAEIARPVVAEQGATHAVVKQAIRDAGKPISNDRLGELVQLLKDEQTEAAA